MELTIWKNELCPFCAEISDFSVAYSSPEEIEPNDFGERCDYVEMRCLSCGKSHSSYRVVAIDETKPADSHVWDEVCPFCQTMRECWAEHTPWEDIIPNNSGERIDRVEFQCLTCSKNFSAYCLIPLPIDNSK